VVRREVFGCSGVRVFRKRGRVTNVSPDLREIEERLPRLSFVERVLLIERLARTLRPDAQTHPEGRAEELAAMAADPQIRREIAEIEEEFAGTLLDGLETEDGDPAG
jgi:hypothetical protein